MDVGISAVAEEESQDLSNPFIFGHAGEFRSGVHKLTLLVLPIRTELRSFVLRRIECRGLGETGDEEKGSETAVIGSVPGLPPSVRLVFLLLLSVFFLSSIRKRSIRLFLWGDEDEFRRREGKKQKKT